MSYTQAEDNFGSIGFLHATQSEVRFLFSSVGFSAADGQFRIIDFEPAGLMYDIMGVAFNGKPFYGIYDFDEFSEETAGVAAWEQDLVDDFFQGMASIVDTSLSGDPFIGKNTSTTSKLGNFMVRAAVPLPPSVALFGTALLGLAVIRRRKRPGSAVSQQGG